MAYELLQGDQIEIVVAEGTPDTKIVRLSGWNATFGLSANEIPGDIYSNGWGDEGAGRLRLTGQASFNISVEDFNALFDIVKARAQVTSRLKTDSGAAAAPIFRSLMKWADLAVTASFDGTFTGTIAFRSCGEVSRIPNILMTPDATSLGTFSIAAGAITPVQMAVTGSGGSDTFAAVGTIPGLAMDAAGEWTGTPIAGSAGTYWTAITSTDTDGVTQTRWYTATITA